MYFEVLTNVEKQPVEMKIFDSIAEATSFSVRNGKQYPKLHLRNYGFTGREFETLKELEKAVNSYWKEGMGIISEMLIELSHLDLPKPKSIRRKMQWNEVEGDSVDIDRLRTGQPFWRRAHRQKMPSQQSITIVNEITTPSKRKYKEVFWKGAASVILTHLLEQAGYRVELWMYNYSTKVYHNYNSNLIVTRLKATTEPLNLSALVNCVSGWFYRTIYFGLMEHSLTGSTADNGLGYAVTTLGKDLMSHITQDKDVIHINKIWSREEAKQLITMVIEDFQNGD